MKASKVKKYKVVEKQTIKVHSDIIFKSSIPRYSNESEGNDKE